MKPWAMLLVFAAPLLLAACESESVEPLSSPCVGMEESPCGPKRSPAMNHARMDTPRSDVNASTS